LDLSIEEGELADQAEFNLGNVFKVCTQNDRSIFYTPKIEKKRKIMSL
jgi:hypothetical protein